MKILSERNDDWLDHCNMFVGTGAIATLTANRCFIDGLHHDVIGD